VDLAKIRFDNVVQRFRVIRERPDTLREVFTRLFSRNSRVYDFDALKGINFTIRDGEAVGIVGRNGSGKSTTLKIIAGVYRPTSGRVVVSGRVAPLIELAAGFHGDLTGRENIVLNGLLLGLSRREIMASEDRIIGFAALGDFIDSPVKQYSSGMYMRLGFAVATEVDPDILLIDEILAVGDAEFQQKCMARIEEFRQRGKTIVLVSHTAATIRQLCPRAIFLDGGTIVADGPAEEVLAKYIESQEGHQEAPHLSQEGAPASG
jgi:ABC-type polysaccharide/polyol phosphate transport system ATPase subunit